MRRVVATWRSASMKCCRISRSPRRLPDHSPKAANRLGSALPIKKRPPEGGLKYRKR